MILDHSFRQGAALRLTCWLDPDFVEQVDWDEEKADVCGAADDAVVWEDCEEGMETERSGALGGGP